MALPLITQSDIEAAIGVRRLAELADVGEGVADPDVVAMAINISSARAYGLLGAGYPDNAAAKALVDNDASARNAIVDLAIAWLGMRPSEFQNSEQMAPFERRQSMALKALNEWARGITRSAGEVAAGSNPNLDATVTKGAPSFDFTFATNRGRPNGRGGF